MDIYGSGGGSRDEWFIDDNNYHHRHLPLPYNSDHHYHDNFFSHFPSLHSDEAAELEWVSQFVDDTTSFIPDDIIIIPDSKSKSKKKEMTKESSHAASTSKRSKGGASAGMGVRRCSHCASEKTPQWRSGPLGPKTLCNACGVRFKSGRLVPEYRPAASPTFVLTQHSNSHRKVMELRRQKHLAAPPTINTL